MTYMGNINKSNSAHEFYSPCSWFRYVLRSLVSLRDMSNSVRRYPGYGYDLAQGHVSSGPQYLATSIREAKCTCLGYETRLSRLHILEPPLALAFPRSSHLATTVSK
jgi:hypothetical protein